MNRDIYRFHYRGHLQNNYDNDALKEALQKAEENVKALVKNGSVMTAALYQHEHQLFFYYESIGEKLNPEELLGKLGPFLAKWPGEEEEREWVHMKHIYYHAIPEGEEDWKRTSVPDMRRGRIAFLKEEKLFDYVYHHVAIVKEGLLPGDKYQSIAIHENILFSYFEEPRGNINIRRDLSQPSKEIDAWLALDPSSHFIPDADGKSFTFLPAILVVGQEMA